MELIHRIVDTEKGTTIDRPLNEKELADFVKEKTRTEALFAKEAEKNKLRDSALAKLAALGLTEDEIAAL